AHPPGPHWRAGGHGRRRAAAVQRSRIVYHGPVDLRGRRTFRRKGLMMHETRSHRPSAVAPFVKLADPGSYVACSWDLTQDAAGREHWVAFFKRHINTILSLGVQAAIARGEDEAVANRRADACRAEFYGVFDAYAADPASHGRVTILTLDEWRDQLLRKYGFVDA